MRVKSFPRKGATLVDNMKDWEVIAENLSKAGWSWGCVSAIDSKGDRSGLLTRTATTERDSSSTDEKLTAFLELSCLGATSGIREIGLVFSRVRSKLRQCGNLREDVRENVGAQKFVLDIWNRLLAS